MASLARAKKFSIGAMTMISASGGGDRKTPLGVRGNFMDMERKSGGFVNRLASCGK
jgi:hypothetical protein